MSSSIFEGPTVDLSFAESEFKSGGNNIQSLIQILNI